MQEPNGNIRFPSPNLTVAALRRASPSQHLPVTRTLRITEAELSSREVTPLRVTLEDLTMRPRSNPRSRTPMRYESPLNHSEFRRESLGAEDEARQSPPQRITIRPLAGAAVGTTNRIREDRPVTPKSRKQGPSHRKMRRWNNDHFNSLASEIASSSRGVANVLLKAQGDAHLYKNFVDFKDKESQAFNMLMTDARFESLRDRFLDGEMPMVDVPRSSKSLESTNELSARIMIDRIDPRLKRVVFRAGSNSQPALLVMKRLEKFVVRVFAGALSLEDDRLADLLLAPPSVHELESSRYRCQFLFHAELPSGGFHRLLLQAICQFHGLQVVSKTMDVRIGSESQAIALTVTGLIALEDKFLLCDEFGADDCSV
ncbi:hypothetical protein MPSEU_000960800 [Mayamaea pseudoterrestris]|nr:hypothetical protein MPSEU_000960800 [Mayamaea pseudoterrestris]